LSEISFTRRLSATLHIPGTENSTDFFTKALGRTQTRTLCQIVRDGINDQDWGGVLKCLYYMQSWHLFWSLSFLRIIMRFSWRVEVANYFRLRFSLLFQDWSQWFFSSRALYLNSLSHPLDILYLGSYSYSIKSLLFRRLKTYLSSYFHTSFTLTSMLFTHRLCSVPVNSRTSVHHLKYSDMWIVGNRHSARTEANVRTHLQYYMLGWVVQCTNFITVYSNIPTYYSLYDQRTTWNSWRAAGIEDPFTLISGI